MYLSYVGIRTRDLPRSVRFYRDTFGLEVLHGRGWEQAKATEAMSVLLRDPASGQRLEINYYPEGNPYAVPYAPGEELDHLAFRVDDLPSTLERLAAQGIRPERMKHYDGPFVTAAEYRCAYVRDPDGIQLELFDAGAGRPPVPFASDQY